MTRELTYQAAILFLLTVALGLLVLMWREHRPAEVLVEPVAVTPSSEPASRVPWRLYSTCPVNRTNVPILQPERKT